MRLPDDVRTLVRTQDPTRPRLTWYGPESGDRVELSGKVLDNWAAKVGNLLQEELDLGPRGTVRLDLPAGHWRALYWALGAWSVGATVEVGAERPVSGADVLVTARPQGSLGVADASLQVVAVNLEPLARRAAWPLQPGDIDEARQLSSYGDVLDTWARPEPASPALRGPDGLWSFDTLIAPVDDHARLLLTTGGSPGVLLRGALSAWAADGSVVITPRAADAEPARLAAIEHAVVTDPDQFRG